MAKAKALETKKKTEEQKRKEKAAKDRKELFEVMGWEDNGWLDFLCLFTWTFGIFACMSEENWNTCVSYSGYFMAYKWLGIM